MQQADIVLGSAQIIMIDLVLAGDNAVVIGMAARTLPPRQRKMAILVGALAAVVLRVIATLMVSRLLDIPFLSAIGGLAVCWIAVKLLVEDEEVSESHKKEIDNFWHACRIIAAADIIMSIDNVLAVGGAANAVGGENEWKLIVFGLLLSIPLVMFCSSWVANMLDRWPRLAEVGAAVLGYTGGGMILHDIIREGTDKFGLFTPDQLGAWKVALEWGARIGLAIGVVLVGRYLVRVHEARRHKTVTAA